MDKNRLDALFSGLTRAKDSEDKQQPELLLSGKSFSNEIN